MSGQPASLHRYHYSAVRTTLVFVGLLLRSGYLCNYYRTGRIQLLHSAALFRLQSFIENITVMMLIARLPLQSVGETNLARE